MGTNQNLAEALFNGAISPVIGAFQGLEQGVANIHSAIPNGVNSSAQFLVIILAVIALLIGLKISGVLVV